MYILRSIDSESDVGVVIRNSTDTSEQPAILRLLLRVCQVCSTNCIKVGLKTRESQRHQSKRDKYIMLPPKIQFRILPNNERIN